MRVNRPQWRGHLGIGVGRVLLGGRIGFEGELGYSMEVERMEVRNAYSSSEGTGTFFFSGVGTL